MVSHRVALLLLAVAARRWPAELREDLRREWTAELHTLAADRQHLGMLRFAASLAARRSGIEAADRLARRAPSGGWRVVAGVVTPLALTVLALWYAMRQDVNEVAVAAPGLVLWLAGLALVLRAAVALAERGRVRAAWWVGLLSAFVVADAAVVLTVLGAIPTGPETVLDGLPQGDTVNPVSAPMWLLVSWTDSALGLPRPTGQEIFRITDVVLPLPQFYLAPTPYALAWAIRAARTRPAPGPVLAIATH